MSGKIIDYESLFDIITSFHVIFFYVSGKRLTQHQNFKSIQKTFQGHILKLKSEISGRFGYQTSGCNS